MHIKHGATAVVKAKKDWKSVVKTKKDWQF